MTAKRRYQVFNCTDGIWASPFPMTLEEAEEFVKDFPERYERQGYYLTASRQRSFPGGAQDITKRTRRYGFRCLLNAPIHR